MAVPLWKDYVVNLGTGDSIQYRILLHDVEYVIYTGKAYKKPGETNITVKVNDICADYIVNVQAHELQHARLPCPSPTPRACSKTNKQKKE